MGLDQYWEVITSDIDDNNLSLISESNRKEIAYHRKVPILQEFMENHGATNCGEIFVTEDLLDELDEMCENRELDEEASGFFWGTHKSEHYEEIQKASAIARSFLENGDKVIYWGWY